MTDKEFKRLNRSQLIEIIYQFQIKVEELTLENQKLNAALEDKRLRIAQAGNIAEAALSVNNVMQAAQSAAQQYLDEILALRSEADEACESIRRNAAAEADAIIMQARADAAAIRERAAHGQQGEMDFLPESDE
jgi:cell division septum initiation protein DivIVA